MRFEKAKNLSAEKFRRLTGVKQKTFEKMVEILKQADKIKKSRGGRKSKLIIEDMLIMTLEYLREYRTYFHIAQNYGISESNAYKIIKWVEDTLIKDPNFRLPGKKEILERDNIDIILIDATETPIERPKKTKKVLFRKKEKAYIKNTSCC